MNVARALLYVLGAILVIAGIWMLFVETGLAGWIPTGILIAGAIILIGLFVMGMSDRSETHHHH